MNVVERRSFLPAIESLDEAGLRALQERKFLDRMERLRTTNPFYRDHLARHGVDMSAIRSLEHVADLPFTTKEDLLADQEEAPPYGRRLGIPVTEVYELTMTSGTSGKGREVHAHSMADAHLRGHLTATGWTWAGLRAGDVAVAHVGANNAASLWTMTRGIRAVASMPYLVGHLSFDERIEHMERFGVDLMYAMPSALSGLATRCEMLGAPASSRFPRLRSIMTSGESWPVAFVERMEEAWGARIFEVYGSTQTVAAYGAATCELGAVADGQRGRLHLFEWTTLYEILDPDTLEPVGPGEQGELVLTHLDKEASPLLRFRTGDLVRLAPDEPCPCGRQLRGLEAGTIGRVDDMLKIRGQNVWTSTVDALVLAHADVDELQVEVRYDDRGRDVIDMRVARREGAAGSDDEFVATLVKELKEATDLRFDVRIVPPETLPHFDSPDRKARRWTDRRHEGLAGGELRS